jgi:hypothetical protein
MVAPAFFHVESPKVARNLREKITDRRAALIDQIASGLASNHEDYRYRIGKLEGLTEALYYLEELEKNERN